MKTKKILVTLRCGLLLLGCARLAPALQAANTPPELMSYQGYLTDANGNPLGATNTGPLNYDVVFRIFDAATSGNELWAEQQTVTVDRGNFSVMLGQGSPYLSDSHASLSSLFSYANGSASTRYIEMTVMGINGGNNVTMTPRLQLLSSPYSLASTFAVNANNLQNISGTPLITSSGNSVSILASLGVSSETVTNQLNVSSTLNVASNLNVSSINAGSIFVTNQLNVGSNVNVAGSVFVTNQLTANVVNASSVNLSSNLSLINLYASSAIVSNQLNVSSLNITGTNCAGTVQVTNTIRLGTTVSNTPLYATASEETNLRIIRGMVYMQYEDGKDDSTAYSTTNAVNATAYTVKSLGDSLFEVDFAVPFGGQPVVTATVYDKNLSDNPLASGWPSNYGYYHPVLYRITPSSFKIQFVNGTGDTLDEDFTFFAIGPR